MKKGNKDLLYGILFISPWLIGFLWFTIFPMLASLYYSFTDYNMIQAPSWVGADNFKELFSDPLFGKTLYNTLWFAVFGLPLTIVLSLGLAVLLNQKIRGQAIYRTIFYVPSVVPLVAASLCWMWFLNPLYGPLNKFLEMFGIIGPNWLRDMFWAKPGILMTILWVCGPTMIIFLAALQDVPQQLIESAALDGAGALRRFFHIVLPMLSPTIFFNVVMGIINTFQIFVQPYIMTVNTRNPNPGGPANATLVFAIHLFNKAFKEFQMGYASALAWVLFGVIFSCTLLMFLTSASWVYYEAGGDNK